MQSANLELKVVCNSCRWSGKVKDLHSKLVNLNGKVRNRFAIVTSPCCPNCKGTDLVYKDGVYII